MNIYQERILQLAGQRDDLGELPLRRIAELIELKPAHPQAVKYHLEQLEKRGLIIYNRTNKIIKKKEKGHVTNDLVAIPILGFANCGEANMFAEECWSGLLQISKRFVPKSVHKEKVYAVQSSGDSMNRARVGIDQLPIESGDYVLVDSENKNPKNGDYVLSVIDGLANIKKFIKDNNGLQVTLASESASDYPPIVLHKDDKVSYYVAGTAFGVIKKGGN